MPTDRHFVGREAELDRFRQLLDDPAPHAVLITGGQGMGKSFLSRRMVEVAEDHPALQCGAVRYEVARSDSVDSVMALMLDHAFAAIPGIDDSFAPSEHRRKQWRTLFEAVLPKGAELVSLVSALRRDLQRSPREQLIEALHALSARLGEEHRVLFLIDAEKEMPPGSDQAWATIVRQLPPRVVLLFPQRPGDELAASDEFRRTPNVVCIPEEPLERLAEPEVDSLLEVFGGTLPQDGDALREHLARLEGHPYAVAATLDLLEQGVQLGELPLDPGYIAGEQCKRILARGAEAQRLFEAYALLEVPVPDEVAIAVAAIDRRAHTRLLADPYLNGLLLGQESGRRVYHSLLANRILSDLTVAEKQELHRSAVTIYSERLNRDARPDELAATRLPHHAEGTGTTEVLVSAGVPCIEALQHLGFVTQALALAKRLQPRIEEGSAAEAALLNQRGLVHRTLGDLALAEQMHRRSLEINERLGGVEGMANAYGNLGLIYRVRGDLDQAEQMLRRSLEIEERLGRLEGMANAYGNLGLIYQVRGDLDEAEQMHRRSLEIEERLGRLEGMATQYGNLGLIYQVRGDLDEAEQMHRRSLEINERLGRLEGMGTQYGNLGLIYRVRGELDEAQQMHRRSLEIEERLGRLEGMARAYGNLGVIYKERGELDEAEQMLRRSLALFQKIGAKAQVEQVQRLLAGLALSDEP